ncbi:hypothetical protein BP6252_06521 [Coleophoma cylindrospora]|uniref:NodB homology domain-containing protein n=1 Tax=Coleophoma cylindrospora TaxID=1849047 RepID=A0A3D8RMV1_9HELO|nr:hypothetical protein BP6252_06521 [Coleophoma cylindrospora]
MVRSVALLLLITKLGVASFLETTTPARQASQIQGYQTACTQNTAVTFDDGPYIYEQALVNTIVAAGAKGTLFGCIYDDQNVQALRHAYESGFTIGSHTWNHYNITLGTTDNLGHQLDLVETALWNILGVKPALFRPPYGAQNAELVSYLNSRGYTVVGWSTDTQDSVGATVATSEGILNAATAGNLFLAHETIQTTVQQVIPDTIPGLVARGVNLVTVDQCLGVNPYQAVRGSYGERDASWTCQGTPAPGQGF